MFYVLLFVLGVQIFTPTVFGSVNLKGVHPDYLARYKSSSSTFTCFDGSRTIDISQLNDDYCDCPDGSDEPGTSACPNSWFYCRNKGHEPKLLASQFVQDGICDCCDGTDEPKGVCANTCHLAIAAEKEKLQKSIDEYKQALTKKEEYIAAAKTRREEFAARASTIDAEIDQQSIVVKQLEEEKDRLESEHRAQEDAARAEHEAKEAAEREAREKEEAERQAAEEKEQQEAAESAAASTPEEHHEDIGSTEAAEGQAESAEGDDSTLSAEELGRKIASQWTNDPEAAGNMGEAGESAEDYPEDEHHHHDDHVDAWDSGADEFDEPEPEHDFRDSPGFTGVPESEELKLVRSKYYAEQAKLSELEKFKKELDQVQGLDLGTYDEYLQLSGRCLTSYETQFTYEACFFDQATQREGSGGRTVIGKWKGFEAGHTVAVFDDGDWCWQAPNRSLKLHLECSLEEKMYQLEEPGKCVYAGKFKTPAACDEAGLKKLEDDLARLRQIEEEIKNEIVHDEL